MKTSLGTSEETMTNAGVAQLVEQQNRAQRATVQVRPPAPYRDWKMPITLLRLRNR